MKDIIVINQCNKPRYIDGCPKGRNALAQTNRCSGCEWNNPVHIDNKLRQEVSQIKKDLQDIKLLLKASQEPTP